MTAQETTTLPFAHPVKDLIKPYSDRRSFVPDTVWPNFTSGLYRHKLEFTDPTVTPKVASEILIHSFKNRSHLLCRIATIISADSDSQDLPPEYRSLFGLEDDGNVRFLLDLAAGTNRLYLEGEVDRIRRNESYFGNPTSVVKSTARLVDEIDELKIFQDRIRERVSTTPPAMRK